METKIRCYRISGRYGSHDFQETTYAATQVRAESNVRWQIHHAHRYTPTSEIVVTMVEILNKDTNKFEKSAERIS